MGVCILQSQRRKFRLPRAYETLHGLYFSPPDSESLTGAEASVFFKCPRCLWTWRWRTSALTDLETSHCHTSTCACKFLFLQSKLKPLFSYVISLICQACSCLRAFAYLSNISSSAFLFQFIWSQLKLPYQRDLVTNPSVTAPPTYSSLLTHTFNTRYLQSSYHQLTYIYLYVNLPVDPCLFWFPPRKRKLQIAKIFWFVDCFYLRHWHIAM